MPTRMNYIIINTWEERREQEVGLAEVTIPHISGKQLGMNLQKFKSSQVTKL